MKKVACLLALALLCLAIQGNAKTTTATSSGNWTAAIWDNGSPAPGDVINIPLGIIVDISSATGNVNLRTGGVTTINVIGTLRLSNLTSFLLDNGDNVNVSSTGTISNGSIGGGFISFGDPVSSFISVSLAGVISSVGGYLGTSPLLGPITVSNGVLPITLTSFEAVVSNNQVNFKWITASELNNSHFILERFDASDNFYEITTVPGAGTTNEMSTYEVSDFSPLPGKNYYRLKQTDFDGRFTYSDVVMVEFFGTVDRLSVYPNPLSSGPIKIDLKNAAPEGTVAIQILDSKGIEVFKTDYLVDKVGFATGSVEENLLKPGIYYVKAGEYSKKLIVE